MLAPYPILRLIPLLGLGDGYEAIAKPTSDVI
jgi:hypothetical protein